MDSKQRKISNYFIDEHDKINRLLFTFMKLQSTHTIDTQLFQNIKFILEKHIYLEEKIMFDYFGLCLEYDHAFAEELMKQHDKVLSLLHHFQELINNQIEIEIEELGNQIQKNIEFEKDFFYSIIDQTLDGKQREFLLNKINEIPNMGFFPLTKIREYGIAILKKYSCD